MLKLEQYRAINEPSDVQMMPGFRKAFDLQLPVKHKLTRCS